MDPNELRRQMAAKAEEARKIYERAQRENRDVTSVEKSQYDALVTQAKNLRAQADAIEAAEGFTGVSKPMPERRGGYGNPSTAYRSRTADNAEAIACTFIRTGDVFAGREMHEAAIEGLRASNNTIGNITTPADGGYAVPTGHHREIIARRDEAMLAKRMGVRPIPGIGTTVNVPIDNEADGEFAQTSEQNDAHSNNFDRDMPAISQVAMTLVKYTKKVELTDELLYDQDSNLLAFIEDWVGRGMARTHNQLLVNEVLANGTAGLTLDAAAGIGMAEIPELVGKLQPEYRDGAQWLMNPTTFSYLQGLNSANNFVFAPTQNGDPNGSLWGYAVNQSSYVPAYAAGNKSLVYGNFRYVGLREAPALTLLRDPYSVDGAVVLKYQFRCVYKVLQTEALQYASHPTA